MKKIEYDFLKESEIKKVYNLIKDLFEEYIGIDYSQAGKDTFLDYIKPTKFKGKI